MGSFPWRLLASCKYREKERTRVVPKGTGMVSAGAQGPAFPHVGSWPQGTGLGPRSGLPWRTHSILDVHRSGARPQAFCCHNYRHDLFWVFNNQDSPGGHGEGQSQPWQQHCPWSDGSLRTTSSLFMLGTEAPVRGAGRVRTPLGRPQAGSGCPAPIHCVP